MTGSVKCPQCDKAHPQETESGTALTESCFRRTFHGSVGTQDTIVLALQGCQNRGLNPGIYSLTDQG